MSRYIDRTPVPWDEDEEEEPGALLRMKPAFNRSRRKIVLSGGLRTVNKTRKTRRTRKTRKTKKTRKTRTLRKRVHKTS